MRAMDFTGAGGNFMEQLLRDLLGLMGGMPGSGPNSASRVDLARTLALGVATGSRPEANVDPGERMELEQLVRVAELHVAELTGLPITPTGAPVEALAVGPGAWAAQTVEDWRALLEAMTEAAPSTGPGDEPMPGSGPPGLGLADLDDEPGAGSPADLVARFATTMGPMLSAMQFGSAIGHLAQTTLGQYELPVPRTDPRLFVVPANITRFAEQWSLPADQARLWICVRDLTMHAVLSRPAVAERIRHMLVAVVADTAQDAATMLQRFEGLDLSDPESLQRAFSDPESWLGDQALTGTHRSGDELAAAVSALLGYVEHILERAGSRLLGGHGAVAEAWRRRQVAREPNERAAEALLGLDVGPAVVDRGADFVRGVMDRAGEEGLSRLWTSGRTLPTPAELDAPGLWLERIDIDGGD
jgi:putative hydrolase